MKVLFLILFFILSLSGASSAVTSKKKSLKKNVKIEDKVYTVKEASPEILIGEEEEVLIKKVQNVKKRPKNFWYMGIIRTSLDYQLVSATSSKFSFSPYLVGFIFGKKTEFPLFSYNGQYEINGEWQRFKRESLFGNNMTFSQNLDLYQMNFFLNIMASWARINSIVFSTGLGMAPVYLTTDQSVFGYSTSELGYMGMLKGNILYTISKNYELDIALRFGFGKVSTRSISTTSLVLGLNFE